MPQKRYRPEEIIAKLREAEVLLGQGGKVPEGQVPQRGVDPDRRSAAQAGARAISFRACAAATDERAAETIARLAGFPTRKRLEEFDFVFQASINRRQVGELASCAFIERAENVVLLGPPGVGKTHLAIALGLAAAGRRYSVKFTTAARLVASLAEARGGGSFTRRLSSFCRPRLLIVAITGTTWARPWSRTTHASLGCLPLSGLTSKIVRSATTFARSWSPRSAGRNTAAGWAYQNTR
jgi:DNA replication protein DnaC